MIDRSYLPFQSAREYQDRKMQKWMGFFLSEHSSALGDDANQVSYISGLSTDKKLLSLSQAYANQLTTRICVLEKNELKTFIGTMLSISKELILLKTVNGHENILISDIISINPVKEVIHEST